MTATAWIIVWACVLGVVGYVYHVAHARGYASGQHDEHQAISRVFSEERQRALAAEQDIAYLYELARWQIAYQGPAAARSEE